MKKIIIIGIIFLILLGTFLFIKKIFFLDINKTDIIETEDKGENISLNDSERAQIFARMKSLGYIS